jgi:hypothetical protein
MQMAVRTAITLLSATLSAIGTFACSGSSSTTTDSGLHPSPGVCMPDPTATGNSLHVGAYCTKGQDQCAAYDQAKLCAIDLDPEGGNFCLKIGCMTHSDCGEQACCTGRAGVDIHACVPKGCLVDDAGGDCPPLPQDSDAGSGSDSGGGGIG